LDPKPANLERHLHCSQKYTCKLGQVLDVHSRTLALSIAQALLVGDNFDYLRPRQH
jgi:hypothetical protein